MALHVINEARRCLQCKKPLCRTQGCPIGTNIPEMIHLFLDGNPTGAGEMLFENNPLSVFCALVCDHEAQCEGHCVQGIKGTPVQISSIESYISDSYLDRAVVTRGEDKGQSVAVIGAGPAGLTVAVKLAQLGYGVTIFERKSYIGGMLRYGIPDFRLPKSILNRYEKKLHVLGINIRRHVTIGGALNLDDLFSDGYSAVVIGTGVWRPHRLGVKGETLGNVHYAVNYLQNPDIFDLGERVAVIGAGNSAMDAARTIIRKGSRFVDLYARRKKIAASQREIDYTLSDGVDIHYGYGIAELTTKGPMLYENYFDEGGNIIGHGEPQLYPADSTIIAVSQGPKNKIVNSTTGIETVKDGLISVDENGCTTREGVFSCGDVVTGSKTVVHAVKQAKLVVEAIDKYLTGKRENV